MFQACHVVTVLYSEMSLAKLASRSQGRRGVGKKEGHRLENLYFTIKFHLKGINRLFPGDHDTPSFHLRQVST